MKSPENITISRNLIKDLPDYFTGRSHSGIAVIVDENTHRDCYPLIAASLPAHDLIRIPAGEEHKNLDTCSGIWGRMTEFRLDRNALVVNLGGGVIGDMGGFCAATYKRGIRFINLPTTLLAQVDASIGGKLGIDFQGFKNHIGLFREPEHVFIYTRFLDTLSQRELRSGFAEVIKHCLIADRAMFEEIRTLPLAEIQWDKVIAHSVKIKYRVVQSDPDEKGLRKILNFGHTVGHAIETYFLNSNSGRLLHGEAVAIGMVCESWLSAQKTGLSQSELRVISTYLKEIYPFEKIPEPAINAIAELAVQDKKNVRGTIKCSLLERTGHGVFNIAVTPEEIRDSIRFYNRLPG